MSYNQYRPQPINFLPIAIKNLFIVNGLFFLASLVFQSSFNIDLTKILGLHYWTSPNFHFYQILTHMFMHGSIGHIFFNMFALWMFGASLENRWGAKRFLFFYFFTALGSVLLYQTVVGIEFYNFQSTIDALKSTASIESLQDIISKVSSSMETTYLDYLKSIYADGVIDADELQNALKISQSFYNETLAVRSAVGASGAVFGVLIAFAMYQPNSEIFFLFIPFPIKAKYFVAGYAIMELYLGIQNNPADNVAHFAHLGGALFGYILVKYWNKTNRKSFY